MINQKDFYEAGNHLNVNAFINSICGRHLRVFPQQFFKNFVLKVNNQPWTHFSYTFDKKAYALLVVIKELKTAGRVSLTPVWKGFEGTKLELTVIPGEITKYDICEPSYDKSTLQLNTQGQIGSNTFFFSICSTDQYKNPKPSKHTEDSQLIKVQYPNLIPSSEKIKIEPNLEKTKFLITVPLTALGTYTLYNEQFFNGVKKFFEVKMTNVDSDHSYAEISNYFEKKNSKPNSPVVLYINLKDAFEDVVPADKLQSINCNFESSTIEHTFGTEKKIMATDDHRNSRRFPIPGNCR